MQHIQLLETYEHLFTSMEQQLETRKFSMMLFKNITKRKT
jgi:hypothetical protein